MVRKLFQVRGGLVGDVAQLAECAESISATVEGDVLVVVLQDPNIGWMEGTTAGELVATVGKLVALADG